MNVIGELVWKITGDKSGIDKALKDADKNVNSTGAKIQKVTGNLQKEFKKIESSAALFGNRTEELSKKNALLRGKMEELLSKGVNPNNKGFQKLKSLYDENTKELTKLENQTSKSTKSFGAFGKMLVGGVVGSALVGFAKAAIGGASALQQQTVAFETMLGSAGEAQALLNDISQFAAFTPFSQEGLIENSKLLLNFGIEGDRVIDIMRMLGDVAAGDEQRLSSLSLAFAQVQSAGKLTGQDLLQMINAGFNPLQAIAEKTGKSMGELKDEMSKGAISADMVTEAFQYATSEGGRFFEMSVKQSKTLAGQWSTLKDRIKMAATEMGESWIPLLTQELEYINKKLDAAEEENNIYNQIAKREKDRVDYIRTIQMLEKDGSEAAKQRITNINVILGLLDQELAKKRQIAATDRNAASNELESWRQRGLVADETAKKVSNVSSKSGPTPEQIARWKGWQKEASDAILNVEREFQRLNLSESQIATISANEQILLFEAMRDRRVITEKQYAESVALINSNLQDTIRKAEEDAIRKKIASFNDYTQQIGGALSNLLSSFQAYNDAVYKSKLDRLNAELQAELEAAGVSEETTVEQAQREYDIAQATGSELEKEEKRRALVKAQIEEKYQKKKAQLEYEAALTSWQFQRAIAALQIPLATMNAIASGFQAPAFMLPWFPISMGVIAATTAGAQFAAVEASKPQPPKFAEGGIVPGTSFAGDRVTAQLNSGEMVLNQSQQARLFNAANGAGGSGNITVYLGDEQIYKSLYNASKRGDLIIDARSVVTR